MFDQGSATATDESNATAAPAWLMLHREMKSATRRRSAWDAEHARHLREAEAQQLWNHFGYISILEYLEREHGIEPRTANDRLRVSHALADLPLLEAELEDGSLQYSHVKELTRIITPETEEDWIEAARGKTCGEVQAMVAGRKRGDGPDDPDQPDLRLRWLTLGLPPQTVALYREQLAAIDAELGHRVEEAEAFRIILERSRACPDGASTPAQVSICSHCSRGWQEGEGGRAELAPAEIEKALCDAEHLGSADREQTRKTSTLTRRRRERIIARDQHRCAVPGCRSRKWLDLHHIVHREHGGDHADSNLITLCSGHHRSHHEGRLAITGVAPDGVKLVWMVAPQVNARVGTNESRARVGTNERQAHVGTNESGARVLSNEGRARVGTNEGRARVGTNEGQAREGTNERRARVLSNEGRARVVSNERRARVLSNEGRARVVSNEGRARVGTNESGACVGTNERQAHVGTNEGQARVGPNESQVHVGSNGRQAHVGSKMRHAASARLVHAVMQTQARDALVGLGWKPGIARGAVEEACARVGTNVRIDVLIREALRWCPKPLA